MKVDNYSLVSYVLDGKYDVVQNSNMVTITIVNPLISSSKCSTKNNTIVYIKNNSGIEIYDVLYRECINYDKFTNILVNGKLIYDVNLRKGIFLNNINNGKIITLKYASKNNFSESLLSYKIKIGKNYNNIYKLLK